MQTLNGIKSVLQNKKYLVLFCTLTAAFSVIFIFEWNLILFSNLYVREDLWTPLNLFFLLAISILSSLAITLSLFSLKARMSATKTGFFSIIPAFLTSACPTCAPLLLSFTSTTYAMGMALAENGIAVKLLTIILLIVTIAYLSSTACKCNVLEKRK